MELEHVPVYGSIRITQYNLSEDEVTTFETTSIGTDGKPILGYRETYGIHGEEILVQFPIKVVEFLIYVPVRDQKLLMNLQVLLLKGNKLTILTPYSISDEHPGDLESISIRPEKRLKLVKVDMKGPKARNSISQIKFITKDLRGDNFRYHTNIERITIQRPST